MKYENALLEKSLHFAARIVKLYQYLSKEKKESIISKQIIRSGTSSEQMQTKRFTESVKRTLLQSCKYH